MAYTQENYILSSGINLFEDIMSCTGEVTRNSVHDYLETLEIARDEYHMADDDFSAAKAQVDIEKVKHMIKIYFT